MIDHTDKSKEDAIVALQELQPRHDFIKEFYDTDITNRKRMDEILRDSEQRYHLLIEMAKEGIWVAQNGILKFVNPMVQELTGHAEKELMALPFLEFIYHDDRELVENNFLKRTKGETVGPRHQFRLLRNDKSIKWVEMTGVNIEWEGQPTSINFISDIAEHKQTEEAIRESEKRYRLLIETAREGILVVQGGILKFVNPMILELTGYTEKELMSHPFLEFIHHDDRELVKNIHLQRMKGETVDPRYQFRLLRNDKSIKWVEMTGVNIEWEGQPASINFVSDITERKQTEKVLRESEKRYRLLIETAREGILVAQDGFLKFVNPMILELSGYTEKKLMAVPFLEFVYHDDRELVGNNHLKRMKGETVDPRYQFRLLRNDKSIKWVEMTGVNIEWEGQPASINFISDITERKQAEAEIKLKNEELLKLNIEKDKFFSIIAHDLRGPFCGFLALIQMMAEDLPSLTMAKIQEIVVDLRNSASNLFHLLENLLHWARMQQGLIPIDLKVMDLFPIVNECITLVTEPAKAKGIEIICDIPHDLTVYADSNILQMVIRNLLSNAVKFTNKGGKVNLSAKTTENKSVEISIKDSGIGMSRKMVDQLFRLDVKTNRVGTEGEPSTGLGLMLCKEFIEKHGGNLWVESEEGKGSIFYFTIPCNKESEKIS